MSVPSSMPLRIILVRGSRTPGKADHTYAKVKLEPADPSADACLTSQRSDDPSSAAAVHTAIAQIKSELKHLCSLQVRNPTPPSPSTSTSDTLFSGSLESSFELPLDDFTLPSNLDDDWLADLTLDELLSPDSDMTFKDLSDVPMQQDDDYFPHLGMTTSVSSTNHDESTVSSASSVSDENERDDVNRRGLKKSGGPVRKLARFGNKQVVKYSDEYHDRRVKNNEAVKKSRMKAKEKQKDTESKMVQLATENRSLSDRVDLLMKELQVLKSLYKELNQDLPASAVRALERVNVR